MKTFTLLFALLVAPAAYADDVAKTGDTTAPKTGDTMKPGKAEKLSTSDLQVMAHYHTVNMMEVDLGKAAQKQAASADVKAYGEMLVQHHGDSAKKLKALAKKSGQKIPMAKPPTDIEKQEMAEAKANAAKLKKLKGADFDREYLRMMVADHEKELAKIDAKVAEVKNTELADNLKALKPVLQQHADQARELQKKDTQAMR